MIFPKEFSRLVSFAFQSCILTLFIFYGMSFEKLISKKLQIELSSLYNKMLDFLISGKFFPRQVKFSSIQAEIQCVNLTVV